MAKLEGKVALVTGAGAGIGREIALALAAEGAAVVVNDAGTSGAGQGQDTRPAQQVVDAIKLADGNATANFGNVANWDEAAAMIQQAVDEFSGLDIVVNVAGLAQDHHIPGLDETEWDKVVTTHLKGTFNICRHASQRYREQKSGRFLNLTSSAGFGDPDQLNSAGAKAGILGFTWTLANSMASSNCTANVIVPALENSTESGESTPPNPTSIALLAVYLSSDASANLSGQCFAVSGNTYSLVSQPQVIKTIRNENGWSVDSLVALMPQTFGQGLKIPVQSTDGKWEGIGLNLHRNDLADTAWTDLGGGVKYWMIPLPPYGETR